MYVEPPLEDSSSRSEMDQQPISDHPKFLQFRKTESSLASYVILSIAFTCYFIYMIVSMASFDGLRTGLTMTSTLFALAALSIGWILTLINILSSLFPMLLFMKINLGKLRHVGTLLEPIWVALLLLTVDLMVTFLVLNQDASDHPNKISMPTMIWSLCAPVVLYISIKSTKVLRMATMLIANCALNLALCSQSNQLQGFGPVIFFCSVNAFLLFEYHKQAVGAFLLTNKLHKTNLANERLAKEMRSNELRHIIGKYRACLNI